MEKRKPAAAGYQLPIKRQAKKPIQKTITALYESSEFSDDDQKQTPKKVRKPAKKSHKKAKKHQKTQITLDPKIIAVVLLFIATVIAITIFFLPQKYHTKNTKIELRPTQPEEIYYSHLSGNEIANEAQLNQATTCVMIENTPESRPQSGLDQAGIVYEAIAEGGITRFMAIYQESKPQYIGPVRSVRKTYAEFAKPYQCSIAHVGGSDNALSLIRQNQDFRDIDQFYNDNYYWRSSERSSPHNVYTNFEKLDALNSTLGYTNSEFKGFPRIKPGAKTEIPEEKITTIRVTLSSAEYNPYFEYDESANNYKRFHTDGGAHLVIDENKNESQLAPNVVIAMKVNIVSRDGSLEGYADYQTTGTNDVTIFQNGKVETGKWERTDADSELHFIDETGKEILLNRGQVWIIAYPAGSGSVSWE